MGRLGEDGVAQLGCSDLSLRARALFLSIDPAHEALEAELWEGEHEQAEKDQFSSTCSRAPRSGSSLSTVESPKNRRQ